MEIPLGEKNYPIFPTDNPNQYIRNRCHQGWKEKGIHEKENKKEYEKQVLHELDEFKICGYENYLCIIDDVMQWCKQNHIPTGIGRGSVGGSTVAYLMGITDVDPIQYNLVFERFANHERVTECDIDVDVSSLKRDEVIEYIRQKYGEVYQIRTISYMSDKSAVQRAGKSIGMKPSEIDKISMNMNTLEELPKGRLKEVTLQFRVYIQNSGKHASAVEKTANMLRLEYTQGCFQISSQVMTTIIQSIHTKDVHDIISTVALGRSGVLDANVDKEFIDYRNGKEIKYLHPKLEPILKDTEGIILYQEQIMQLAEYLCGFRYVISANKN